MVKRILVSGLSSYTTVDVVRDHFEKFGELYECILPTPTRYKVFDYGPDNENIEDRSVIAYQAAANDEVLDEELEVEKYDEEKHGSFEKYMRKVGEEESFGKIPRKTCAGYAFVTFVDKAGFTKCMENEQHTVDGLNCFIELAREDDPLTSNMQSKRMFVSFYPLERLSAKELKSTFGVYGKIVDVEFVADSEGPLHFCIVTFTSTESVDLCVKKSHYVRGFQLFVRRAILRETVKIAEQKLKDDATRVDFEKSHGYAGYVPYTATSATINDLHRPPVRVNASDAVSQAQFHISYEYDPSVAAGYDPSSVGSSKVTPEIESSSDLLSGYGYGPRKW